MTFMDEAIKESAVCLETREGGPFGCVIVKAGRIVGRGHNMVLKNNDPTCHGEMEAIRDACKSLGTYDLTGCELYTSAAPCPMCLSAIIWANIKKVYYGNTKEDSAAIGFRDDYIYKFIADKCQDKTVLELEEMDRSKAQKVFADYEKQSHTIY